MRSAPRTRHLCVPLRFAHGFGQKGGEVPTDELTRLIANGEDNQFLKTMFIGRGSIWPRQV